MIYVIASPKGGVGKSTLAINLTAWLAESYADREGSRGVLLIDADRQQSTHTWAYWRDGDAITPTVKCVKMADDDNVEELIPHYANTHEDVIIDVGGYESAIFMRALAYADRVFVPTTTATFDFASTLKMVQLLEGRVKEVNPKLRYDIIFWRIAPRESEDKKCDSYREEMREQSGYAVQTTGNIIHDRLAFKESLIEGKSVFDYPANALYRKAQDELRILFIELIHHYIL